MRRLFRGALVLVTMGVLLTGCASAAVAPPPEIDYEPGEISGTDPDFAHNMADCMTSAGWEVVVSPDNAWSATYPEEQSEAFDSAQASCMSQLGYDAPPPTLTTTQRKKLYKALVALSTCLTREGHLIMNVPSEQAFLDGTLFDPYSELQDPTSPAAVSDEELAELVEKCPEP